MTCHIPFIHKCGADKCAKNKTVCQKYLEYEKALSSSFVNFISKSIYLSKNNKDATSKLANDFKFFKSKISVCLGKNSLDVTEDTCNKSRFCLKIQITPKFFKGISLPNENCPCAGKYSFQCDSSHCATNQNMCAFFKANLKNCLPLVTKRCNNQISRKE